VDQLSILSGTVLIATGPLSSESLMKDIQAKLGEAGLYFYDATSPVVSLDSLDLNHFFWGARNETSDDYLNLPLNKEEYLRFRENLLSAEKVEAQFEEEKLQYFEGCLPIEVLAERGESTLAFSCMKPVGLNHHRNEKVHAIIQFRREKASGELLNMVGFQTRMKWPDQIRVFRQLPGMENAEFVRLGAMHRNSFINAPLHLTESLQLKCDPQFFMAGQITGSEGYSEALATGHYAALQMLGSDFLPKESAIQSLVRYLISSDPRYFQPMNFNFGLMPSVQETHDKMKKRRLGKRERNQLRSQMALEKLNEWKSSQRLFSNSSTKINCRKDFQKAVSEPVSQT
jgi:methylenetetrahydrofolate--tRNA-(uracil-5-)-methyltransferase